ncbi:MAG TPA: hypothetical protein VF624_09780 [Tepidisphaeraceae bacterium]|jgi:hypothetical protein
MPDARERIPPPAITVVLSYGTQPRRYRRWGILAAILAVAAVLFVVTPPITEVGQRYLVRRTLSYGSVSPETVAIRMEPRWSLGSWGSSNQMRYPKSAAYERYAPGPKFDHLAFAHARSAGGREHLVAIRVNGDNLRPANGRLQLTVNAFAAPAGKPLPAGTPHLIDLGPAGEVGQARLSVFAGQPDPNDPAVFFIPLEIQGQPGRLTGRLLADGSVALDASALPKVSFDLPPPGPVAPATSGTPRIAPVH